MYPKGELARIDRLKAKRLEKIERQRNRGVALVARALRPLAWLRNSKLLLPLLPYTPLALGLGLLMRRDALPRLRSGVAFVRLGVFAYGVARAAARKALLPGSRDSREP